MRLSWSQHLQTARTVGAVELSELGSALALMGMALLMLAQDLQGLDAVAPVPQDGPAESGQEQA